MTFDFPKKKTTINARELQVIAKKNIFFAADQIVFYSELKSNMYIFIKSKNCRRVRNIRCDDNNISNTASMSWTFPSFDYLCIHGMRRPFRYGKTANGRTVLLLGDWIDSSGYAVKPEDLIRFAFSLIEQETLLSGSFIYLMLSICSSTWLYAARTPVTIIWCTENLQSVWINDRNWNCVLSVLENYSIVVKFVANKDIRFVPFRWWLWKFPNNISTDNRQYLAVLCRGTV